MFFIAKMRKIPSTPVREMKHAPSEHMTYLKWTRKASKKGGWELHRADKQCSSWWSGEAALWEAANKVEPKEAKCSGVFAPSVVGLCRSHAMLLVPLTMSCCSESFPRKLGDKKQTRKGIPGVSNWYKHIVLKEYMDGIGKAYVKPLTEYQWWALRAIQSTVLSNPWRGWSLWGGNSRTPEKTAKTVGNSLTPSPRWCWARSSVDTRQKTKCARPSPKNHSLHFADGKAGERQ